MNRDIDKFNKAIKDRLEEVPSFLPSAEMLADMEQRLDGNKQEKEKKRIAWWWLLLIPLFSLPLVFTSYYFYQKSQHLQQQVQESTLQLSNIEKNAVTNNANTRQQKDPQKEKQLTVIYDTIYQTVYRTQEQIVEPNTTRNTSSDSYSANTFYSSRNPFYTYSSFLKYPDYLAGGRSRSKLFLPQSSSGGLLDGGKYTGGIISPFAINTPNQMANIATPNSTTSPSFTVLALLNQLPLSPLLVTPYRLEEDWRAGLVGMPEEKKKTMREKLLPLRPTGFNAGVTIMPALSLGVSGNTGFALAYGVTGEIQFREKFRLGIGGHQLNINHELKQDFVGYPMATPDNPGDAVKELYLQLSYLELPIYFRYLWRTNKKIQPFINVGMVSRRALKQVFEYEYIGGGVEYKSAVEVPATGFSVPAFQGGVGLEMTIRKKIYARGQILYRQNITLPTNEYIKPNYLGIDLGIGYRFE